jgi:hypothetical protein
MSWCVWCHNETMFGDGVTGCCWKCAFRIVWYLIVGKWTITVPAKDNGDTQK